MKLEIEKIRARIVIELTTRQRTANSKAADPFWTSGYHTPQKWVAGALGVARHHVVQLQPEPGEDTMAFFRRLSDRVRESRDHGSDFDDEAWWSSTIDEACALITSAAVEAVAQERPRSSRRRLDE